MTDTTVLPAQGDLTQGIPGISAAELHVMQTAAARFLQGLDADTMTTAMEMLTQPADSQAAGKVSASRDIYERRGGIHWMLMPHRAERVSE